jgi:Fe-S cluster assembly protein SufD
MVAVTEHLSTYLAGFEQAERRRAAEPKWLAEARRSGMQRFAEEGFPTTRHEEYKYTNLSRLVKIPFQPAGAASVSEYQIAPWRFPELDGDCLVFVNGRFAADLSRRVGKGGLEVDSLASRLSGDSASLQSHLARYTANRANIFAALNTAFFEDGAVVRIPDRAILESPVHLIFVSTPHAPETVSHPRVLILAGRDSQAAVIENYVGLGESIYWTNAVTEIAAGPNARLEHCRLQQEGPAAFHTSLVEIHQSRDSHVTTHSLSLGGSLVRNDVEVVLDDEAAESTLNGLYAVRGHQHVDNRTCIDHAKPHGTSHQLYKGVLDGHSTGVFNGKIIVRPDAQKTDAIQSNKNLLLSEHADINTKPQLEIDANDVKCTHGATVGQIDEEAVFYLRSRGIGYAEARALLTYAFAADILERVSLAPVRDYVEAKLMTWLAGDGREGAR